MAEKKYTYLHVWAISGKVSYLKFYLAPQILGITEYIFDQHWYNTVKKKAMFQTKVCTKVGNSLFLNLVMIRKWTLFSVKMVNFQNAEMKFVFSWLGFKSKDMCLHELGDNGYECNKQYYQMKANSPFKILNVSNKHLHFILHKRFW